MTDQIAATPETGTAPSPAAQPERAPEKPARSNFRTGEEYEEAMLDFVLEPKAKAEATQEAPPTDEATPEPEPQPDDAGEEPSEEPDNWTLPESLEELAEQLDVPIEDLLARKVKHGDSETTIQDALKGTLREADYTRKTMEFAEERKAFKQQSEEAATLWQQRFQEVETLTQAILSLNQGISDADLQRYISRDSPEYDPSKYYELKAIKDQRDQALRQAYGMIQHQREQGQQVQSQKMLEFRTEQQKLLSSKMPEFLESAKEREFMDNAIKYGATKDLNEQEMKQYFGGAFDHRYVMVLADAMKYWKLEQGKETTSEKVKTVPKFIRPGPSKEKGRVDVRGKAREQLRKTRSDKAALGYLDTLATLGDRK
jgi:hypothetical protein